MVEGFECPNEELCCWGEFAPGRVSQDKLVLGEGSDEEQFTTDPSDNQKPRSVYSAQRVTIPGLCFGARPREGFHWQVPGGRAFTHGAQPGSAWKNRIGR